MTHRFSLTKIMRLVERVGEPKNGRVNIDFYAKSTNDKDYFFSVVDQDALDAGDVDFKTSENGEVSGNMSHADLTRSYYLALKSMTDDPIEIDVTTADRPVDSVVPGSIDDHPPSPRSSAVTREPPRETIAPHSNDDHDNICYILLIGAIAIVFILFVLHLQDSSRANASKPALATSSASSAPTTASTTASTTTDSSSNSLLAKLANLPSL